MEIYINDKPFDATVYDDDITILQRYAEINNSLPEYLRITTQEYKLKDGLRLEVEDVRDLLGKFDLASLADEATMKSILNDYPRLSKVDVVLLWLDQHYIYSANLPLILKEYEDLFRQIDRRNFYNTREVAEKLKKHSETVAEKRRDFKKALRRQQKVMTTLGKVRAPTPGQFEMEVITMLISFDLGDASLPDVFDAIDVSRAIPFVHLRHEGRDWYKVYRHIIPPTEWIQRDRQTDGLYFKILNSSFTRLVKKGKLSSIYSDGVWLPAHDVEIEFSVDAEIGEETIKKRLFESVGDRLQYNIIQDRQLSVKGKFSVEDISFNRAVFADMVSNSPVLSYFLFFNERVHDTLGPYRSAITKKRFSFYYQPNQDYTLSSALTIIVTPHVESSGDKWIDVRVMRASNIQQVNSFREVFSKLLGVYLSEYDAVVNEYNRLLPSMKKEFAKYIKKPRGRRKKDEKTGKRLRKLKERRPDIFRPGYATLCPQTHQPYLVTKEEAKQIKKKYGKHKVMEYIDPVSGKKDWYACEPREPGGDQKYIYPGLRENKDFDHPDYMREVPYVPCCFTEDQYIKPGAILYKTLRAREIEEKEIAKEEKSGDVGHILAPNKRVTGGRFGKVPYYLSFIVKNPGYKTVGKGKQKFLPILRYGVMETPDSFLHCLEKATVPRYSSLDRVGKLKEVEQVRTKMAEMDFAASGQELYDYPDDMIRERLLEKNSYLEPRMWVRLAEIYYNVNIFLYQMDKKHPNGAIVIPRYSQAYLTRDIANDKPTVFILKNETMRAWPYQCELLIKYIPDAKKAERFTYVFREDPFVDAAIRFFYDSNSVSRVTEGAVTPYKPISS